MAGQVQLATSGPQDQFFTVNPDFSYFLESFKKHSNFSKQYVDVDPENVADFGKNVRFKIPQNQGDLLSSLSFKMTLPEIPGAAVVYIESVAHAIIEHVDLVIGGTIVQRLTSDYLQIYSEHNVTQTKQKALEQLVGKYPLRTSDERVSVVVEQPGLLGNKGIVIHNTLGNSHDEDFFVDLPFYFYGAPELALPLCAIHKQEIEVHVKLRDAQSLVIGGDGDYHTLTEPLHVKNFQLCTEVVFLDPAERAKIRSTRRDYLITQLQRNVFDVDAGVDEGTFKLDFMNPVKELYFVIQRQGTTGDGVTQGNFVTVFDYDNIYETVNNKLILYENLDTAHLSLDGDDVITADTGTVTFLKAIQAAIHHSKTQLIRRFYSYSFALQPEEWYPTGQINFSVIKEQILKLKLTPSPNFSRQIRVYASSYNILRVGEGIAETLFNST